jgi:hypothetical protein
MKKLSVILVLGLVFAAGCTKKETSQTGGSEATTGQPSADSSPASEEHQVSDASHGEHGGGGEAVTPASTASGIWRQIDDERAQLSSVINAGSLEQVHHHAFAIRDLVAALPNVSPHLSAAEKDRLAAGVKHVADEAADLDKAGDAGDLDATQKVLRALETTLADLRVLGSK